MHPKKFTMNADLFLLLYQLPYSPVSRLSAQCDAREWSREGQAGINCVVIGRLHSWGRRHRWRRWVALSGICLYIHWRVALHFRIERGASCAKVNFAPDGYTSTRTGARALDRRT